VAIARLLAGALASGKSEISPRGLSVSA
jgi:hypothetical protein